LLITQISIFGFIILHAILWYVFGIHVLTKLCPFVFAEQVGRLEFNVTIIFWLAIFISTLFVGRAFCAWGCMFGAIQDFMGRLARALNLTPRASRAGKWVLVFVVVIVALAYVFGNKHYWPSMFWFIVMILFAGVALWLIIEKRTSFRTVLTLPKYVLLAQLLGGVGALWISLEIFQKGISLVFNKYSVFYNERWPVQAVFAALIAAAVTTGKKRPFCRYLCPIGLSLRFLSAIPSRKRSKVIRSDDAECSRCGLCDKECLMGINPMEEINSTGAVSSPECINCLQCVSKCPRNALDFGRGC
jgi:polyferredoxin